MFKKLHGEYQGFEISISMGIASSEDCEIKDYDTLFKMADKALYAAKHKGGHIFQFYDKTIENVWSAQSLEQKNN